MRSKGLRGSAFVDAPFVVGELVEISIVVGSWIDATYLGQVSHRWHAVRRLDTRVEISHRMIRKKIA